ncbi:MAG: hypothetical protein ACXVP3_04830 [Actinomycetota bacterium]
MPEMDPSSPSGGALDRAKRRLFPHEPTTDAGPVEVDTASLNAVIERIVSARLGDAVDAIQQTASSVMHEIAAEVWRTAGGDKREVQAKILENLARDDALRGLIAHSDERFQALAVRTGRLEDILERLAADTEAATESLTRGVTALETAIGQPALVEVGDLRERLANVVHQISRALESITERDRILVEAIAERVEAHGKVVSDETGRIAQAMEAYVQQGVSALGQLAGRVDVQLGEFEGRFAARVEEQDRARVELQGQLETRVEEHIGLLDQQIDALRERAGVDARDLRAAVGSAERKMHEWTIGLARLVRADAETLRGDIVAQLAQQDRRIADEVDGRLQAVTASVEAATERTIEGIAERLRSDTDAALERIQQSHQALLQQRLDEALSTLDRNMIRMGDHLEAQLDRLGDVVGTQAAQASSAVIATRVGEAMQLMQSSQADVQKAVEDKITGLARFIRSDNRVLAERVRQLAESDTSRQALRAVKEMQANLPDEIMRVVEMRIEGVADRFHRDIQETTESIAKIGEALERKVEQMTARIAQRQDKDMQVVVERMGDAMHALASLNRPLVAGGDRIDID